MRFDLWRNVSEIYREWNDHYFIEDKKENANEMFFVGEKGSGKTSIAQEYIKKHPRKTRYFSLVDWMENREDSVFVLYSIWIRPFQDRGLR